MTASLKDSHFQAMRELGYTEPEIEEDWALLKRDLDAFYGWLEEKRRAEQIRRGANV